MSNYPPGTWEGDPRAPWNQPEAFTCAHPSGECDNEVEHEDDLCPECEEVS